MSNRFSPGVFSLLSFVWLIDGRDTFRALFEWKNIVVTHARAHTPERILLEKQTNQSKKFWLKLSLSIVQLILPFYGFTFSRRHSMSTKNGHGHRLHSPELHGIIVAGHTTTTSRAAPIAATSTTITASIFNFGHLRFGFLIAFRWIAFGTARWCFASIASIKTKAGRAQRTKWIQCGCISTVRTQLGARVITEIANIFIGFGVPQRRIRTRWIDGRWRTAFGCVRCEAFVRRWAFETVHAIGVNANQWIFINRGQCTFATDPVTQWSISICEQRWQRWWWHCCRWCRRKSQSHYVRFEIAGRTSREFYRIALAGHRHVFVEINDIRIGHLLRVRRSVAARCFAQWLICRILLLFLLFGAITGRDPHEIQQTHFQIEHFIRSAAIPRCRSTVVAISITRRFLVELHSSCGRRSEKYEEKKSLISKRFNRWRSPFEFRVNWQPY